MHELSTEEEMLKVFNDIDTDHSSHITADELKAALDSKQVSLIFRWLLLYTAVVLYHVECCNTLYY
jgi:hypothetical protein